MLYIYAVHKNQETGIIERVKYTYVFGVRQSWECSKKEMVRYIQANHGRVMTMYLRNGMWLEGEDVRVVDNEYLRTDSNYIKADNLSELEEY